MHLCVRLMFRPEIDRQSPCGRLPAKHLAAAPVVGKAGALTARRSAPLQTRAPACWPRLDWHAFQAKTGNLVLAHQHFCMRVCAMLALFDAFMQSGPSSGWLVSSKQGFAPQVSSDMACLLQQGIVSARIGLLHDENDRGCMALGMKDVSSQGRGL
jgi:hypothetical protein